MFLHLSVCPQGGGVHPRQQTTPPTRHPTRQSPPWQTPPIRHTLPRHTPPQADPHLADTKMADTHPPGRHPPPRNGHCSGRYASYWSAFLFDKFNFTSKRKNSIVCFSSISLVQPLFVTLTYYYVLNEIDVSAQEIKSTVSRAYGIIIVVPYERNIA